MNNTFMFSGDRFGADQDYSIVYRQLGGLLQPDDVNTLIQAAYNYLNERYPAPSYREAFPTVQDALLAVSAEKALIEREVELLIQTFAHHELGKVPLPYSEALRTLSKRFQLGLVADIWAPKALWIDELSRSGVLHLFEATIFSSDFGIVKPSPHLFLKALEQMQVNPQDALVIGDSIRRDLGGALAAGLPCLIVGNATHPSAYGTTSTLLKLVNNWKTNH